MKAARGSLLVMTLSIIAILSALAVAIARQLSIEIRLTRLAMARTQARAWARSGVYLGLERLVEDARAGGPTYEPYDWRGDEWAVPGGDVDEPEVWTVTMASAGAAAMHGRVRIQIEDEERKLDLNSAAGDQLGRLLGQADLGAAIIAFRSPADTSEAAPADESGPYQKHSAIVAVEELRDVAGMTPALFSELAPQFALTTTAFAQAATAAPEPFVININTVGPEVLLAVSGDMAGSLEARSLIDQVVATRDRGDGAWGPTAAQDCVISDIGQAARTLADCAGTDEERFTAFISHLQSKLQPSGQLGVQSKHFHVRAEAEMDRPAIRYQVEAWVRREVGAEPSATILRWSELAR
jgi:type II secretory pathway component PulK